ncbi:hypothetical protein MJO28_012687 [Puccinia striiformis f. sp. tritici]|uniref:Uncharacterized protein n=1 Tax=Puccinia striiformis f. sp. tritici TaxID=168172 RepID=A0ACC0E104_9BASI|nr:hypothetical protein MJO28_012687 [Puccinia striiformis f. sp. tritici]
MEHQSIIENILQSQAEVLSNINRINIVVADTAAVVLSEDNEEKPARKHGGSVEGRSANIPRGFEEGYQRLYKDYFSESPVYTDYLFQRRFRMHRSLFLQIVHDVESHDRYFVCKQDALGNYGLRPIQKICSALRMLAYGGAADANDEYFRLAESTSLESIDRFCTAKRGFPGMLGSLDCMHWGWKNCPAAWKGQFQGKEKEATIILEAVVSQDLWFWHSFFGLPECHNDINVLDMSPIFTNLVNGVTPKCSFTINGNQYDQAYYLADGIYPDYATLVKTISQPQGLEQKHFAKMQEALRKDVERGFGVLQARFAIVAQPARGWSKAKLLRIMDTCIILHNMIVEDERASPEELEYEVASSVSAVVEPARTQSVEFSQFLKNCVAIRDNTAHHKLKNDLIKHLWAIKGRSN